MGQSTVLSANATSELKPFDPYKNQSMVQKESGKKINLGQKLYGVVLIETDP